MASYDERCDEEMRSEERRKEKEEKEKEWTAPARKQEPHLGCGEKQRHKTNQPTQKRKSHNQTINLKRNKNTATVHQTKQTTKLKFGFYPREGRYAVTKYKWGPPLPSLPPPLINIMF